MPSTRPSGADAGTGAGPETATARLGPFDSHGTTHARVKGRNVEVEHGIPGEVVRLQIAGGKRPRGKIVKVLERASDRVVPPCAYFREWSCGGCQWQQIAYDGQVEHKRAAIERAVRREGFALEVSAVHAMETPWRYRTTAGIALGKSAGFRRHGSLAIVPIRDCPISHPTIGGLMALLNDRLESGEIPDFRGRVRLDVRVVQGDDGDALQILVRPTEGKRSPEGTDLATLVRVLRSAPGVRGIATMTAAGAVEVEQGDLYATALVAGKTVTLAAASFFQTNLRLLHKLIARLQEESAPLDDKRVADVYGGVGIFGLSLRGAAEVVVIESDPLAVVAGERTAASWNVTNVRFVPERAEAALARTGPFDVVVVDPPRTGLSGPVIDVLLETRPATILYVSCLAQSLARDLAVLVPGGYEVTSLELFDFYPQTYHLEVLAVLRSHVVGQAQG